MTDLSSDAKATYDYPVAGQPVHGVATITQAGNDPNKLMPVPGGHDGRVALSYDSAGRVVQMTRSASTKSVSDWYAYDDLGNPVTQTSASVPTSDPAPSVAPASGARTVTEGAFDVDGMRVMRRVTVTDAKEKSSTVTTVFLGDTEITFDSASLRRSLTRSHSTPGGVPVASEEVVTAKGKAPGATAWTWLVADQQHSIRLAKGPGGVKRTAYLPHGTPLGYGNNPALAPGGRGYLNKTHDPNGDIRLDHRAYQPGLNVLTTPDALLTPYDPQNLNPYAYARNNPIGFSDPSGLICKDAGDADCHRTGQNGAATADETYTPLPPLAEGVANGIDFVTGQLQADGGMTYADARREALQQRLSINPLDEQTRAYSCALYPETCTHPEVVTNGFAHPIDGCVRAVSVGGCAGAALNLVGALKLIKGGYGGARALIGAMTARRAAAKSADEALVRVSDVLAGLSKGRSSGVRTVRSDAELDEVYGTLTRGALHLMFPATRGPGSSAATASAWASGTRPRAAGGQSTSATLTGPSERSMWNERAQADLGRGPSCPRRRGLGVGC